MKARNTSVFLQLLLVAMLILLPMDGNTQVVNNGQVISQTAGVVMTIGNLSIENNGSWINHGVLNVNQDWSGSGSYNFGRLNLIGTDQELSGNFETIEELNLLGSGVKTFAQNATIFSILNLASSRLRLAEDSFLSLLETGQLVGGGESSFVIGTLHRFGMGDLFFPVGMEGEYQPVTLLEVGQGENSIGVTPKAPTLDVGATLTDISPVRSWQIDTNENRGIGGVKLPVLDQQYLENSTDVVVAFSEGIEEFEAIIGAEYDGSMSIATLTLDQGVASGQYTVGRLSIIEPPIMVVNVVTANNDGKHDYLRIDNIEFYDENHVEIYNRAGQKVFEMTDYNNHDRVFDGHGNVGRSQLLLTGSYYYSIKLGKKKVETGFIYVKTE